MANVGTFCDKWYTWAVLNIEKCEKKWENGMFVPSNGYKSLKTEGKT